MSSIASKTLAIAKKKEKERLKAVKEDFLDIMRKNFENRIISCVPWKALDDSYYKVESLSGNFNINDLSKVCNEVGFLLKFEYPDGIFLSIPRWVKGPKRTQAQLMLYWSDIEIKREIKARKNVAKKICKEALEKIKSGDFVSSCSKGSYEIKVEVSYSEGTKEFIDEVKSFFEKKNFTLIEIDVESKTWKFRIKES